MQTIDNRDDNVISFARNATNRESDIGARSTSVSAPNLKCCKGGTRNF